MTRLAELRSLARRRSRSLIGTIQSHRTGSLLLRNPSSSGHLRTGQPGRIVEQQDGLVPAAERERRRLVVPGNAVAGPEPGHLAPRELGQPQEDARRLRARHRRRQRQLDPGAACRTFAGLLDDRHPLAAHAHRRQHGELAPRYRGPFRDADCGRLAAADIPVAAAGAEPAQQVPEQRLLKQGPRARARPPPPELGRLRYPLAKAFHGVVQGPAERGLPDDVAAVSRHALRQVGPAGDHGQRLRRPRGSRRRHLPRATRRSGPRPARAGGRLDAWYARRASPVPGPCAAARRRRSRAPGGDWRPRWQRWRRTCRAGTPTSWCRHTRLRHGGCHRG